MKHTVRIQQNEEVDLLDVIRRSPVANVPDAHMILRGYMFASTEVFVGSLDEDIACIAGLIAPTLLSDNAYLWMLSTDVVESHTFLFIRHSQLWVEALLERYEIVFGHCEVKNTKAIRWVRWLGGEFGDPIGLRIPFTIRKKYV